jgi:hypothetical protein
MKLAFENWRIINMAIDTMSYVSPLPEGVDQGVLRIS